LRGRYKEKNEGGMKKRRPGNIQKMHFGKPMVGGRKKKNGKIKGWLQVERL